VKEDLNLHLHGPFPSSHRELGDRDVILIPIDGDVAPLLPTWSRVGCMDTMMELAVEAALAIGYMCFIQILRSDLTLDTIGSL
jgi:hypothetical protein